MKQKRKRLSIDIAAELHHQLKVLAVIKDMTLRKLIILAIMEQIDKKHKDK